MTVTLTTGAFSEKWVDLSYISEESLTVIDGLNMGLKEKEIKEESHNLCLDMDGIPFTTMGKTWDAYRPVPHR